MARKDRDGDAFRRLERLGDSSHHRGSGHEGEAMQRLSQLGKEPKRHKRRLKPLGSERTWKQKAMKTAGIVVVLALIGVGLGAGYTLIRYNQINKLDLSSVLNGGGSNEPMTVLLVGSDSRSDLASGQKKQFGSGAAVAGKRSDTIMLLHIDPATKRAAILSLPRDLYVTIAGTNHKDRINSAFDKGPETLIKTIRNNFNIPIDHYAEVNFDTFRGVVNTVGGVDIPFATPVRDFDPGTGKNLSGLSVPKAGCINLSGDQALSYVRSRHYQVYQNGRWQSDPLSDLGRIQRQQDFIRRVAHKAVNQGSTNPVKFNSLVSAAVNNLTVDKDLSLSDMTRIANRFKSLDPASIQMNTLPNKATTVGDADVLLPDQPSAQKAIQAFLNGPPEEEKKSSDAPAPPTTTTSAPSKFIPGTESACG